MDPTPQTASPAALPAAMWASVSITVDRDSKDFRPKTNLQLGWINAEAPEPDDPHQPDTGSDFMVPLGDMRGGAGSYQRLDVVLAQLTEITARAGDQMATLGKALEVTRDARATSIAAIAASGHSPDELRADLEQQITLAERLARAARPVVTDGH